MKKVTVIFKKLNSKIIIFALVLCGACGFAVAHADIPSSDGTISACYNTATGSLRAIDTDDGQSCTLLEDPLSWSQSSPVYAVGNALTLDYGAAPDDAPATLLSIPNLGTVQEVCDSEGFQDLIYDNTTDSTLTIDGNTLDAGQSSDQDFDSQPNIVSIGSGGSIHLATLVFSSGETDTQCNVQIQATISS